MVNTKRVRETTETTEILERVPLHEQRRDLLTVEPREGYVRRIVNDSENGQRILRFWKAGWRPVQGKKKVGDTAVEDRNVSLGDINEILVGQGQRAILMEIPIELYEEDQRAKELAIREGEQAIYKKAKKDGLVGKISKHTKTHDESNEDLMIENVTE